MGRAGSMGRAGTVGLVLVLVETMGRAGTVGLVLVLVEMGRAGMVLSNETRPEARVLCFFLSFAVTSLKMSCYNFVCHEIYFNPTMS